MKVLISRHRDGEINAVVVEALGSETIRGSGDHTVRISRKGGAVRIQRRCVARWTKGFTW